MWNRILVIVISTLVLILLYVFIPGLKNDRNRVLGDKQFKSDHWKKAAKLYEKVIDYDVNSPKVMTRLGYCYFKTGDVKKAITTFNKSIRIDSTKLKTYRWLGDAFLQEEDYLNAGKAYQKLISLYRAHHLLDKSDADDYMYALDKSVFCDLKLKNDSLALRQLHNFASALRMKIQ